MTEHSDQADPQTNLTVAQMAAVTGLSAHTLRYYERVGLLQPVDRNSGNQRRYQPHDVEWVRFLLRLRETDMPISQMLSYAELRAQGEGTLADRLRMLTDHQHRLQTQIERLQRHNEALRTKITSYRQMLANHSHDDDEHPVDDKTSTRPA